MTTHRKRVCATFRVLKVQGFCLSSGRLTKLAVAVKLSLILLFPAFTRAESVVCEVRLCGEEKQRRRTCEKDGQHRGESPREGLRARPHPPQARISFASPLRRLNSLTCPLISHANALSQAAVISSGGVGSIHGRHHHSEQTLREPRVPAPLCSVLSLY